MSILAVNSKATRQEQYKRAWNDLLKPDAPSNSVAQAKCWLTYRVIDGEISKADWVEKILPIDNKDTSLRWQMSQATADMYASLLVANDIRSFINKGLAAMDLIKVMTLSECPGASLNFLRCSAMTAYFYVLEGSHDIAEGVIKTAYTTWCATWQSFNAFEYPFRFEEARLDCSVLISMQAMAHHMGKIGPDHEFKPSWAKSLIESEKNLPWMRCLEKLSRAKAIW